MFKVSVMFPISVIRHRRTYQPEALHVVSRRWRGFHDIAHTAETSTILQGSPLDKALEHLPAPLAVLLITSNSPHVEQTFHGLWSLQVVGVLFL